MIGLLRTYLRPYGGRIVVVMALLLVQAIGNLFLPDLNGDIINKGVLAGDTDYVLRVGGLMLLVTALIGLAAIASVYLSARIAMGFGRDVRGAIFTKVETFSQVEVNRFGPPSLITRNTNDVQQVQQVLFVAMTVMVSAPILIVGGVIMALRTDVPLSGLLVVVIPAMGILIGLTMSRLIPIFRATQTRLDRINQVMRESLSGVRVIRAFVRTRHEEARFEQASRELFDVQLRGGRTFAFTQPIIMAIFNLSTVAAIWFGALRVESGDLSIGNLTAFQQYLAQILFAVLTATFMFILVPRAAVSAGRIREVLDTTPSIVDPIDPVAPPIDGPDAGVVEFRNVEFRYPGAEEPVLRGISFRARPGTTTAIVGSTGSGKSTLVNLIPRFYDATTGTVLVDGVDVKAMRREEVWARIGMIPQKAFLFSGTISSNLRFGKADATDDEIWRALDIAQGRDFVEAMDGQLEAPIAQGGGNVSGGQRQRLAIARAIVKGAAVYVFDDSFSALDFATDARLRQALDRNLARATKIIVAQRVGTIMNADQIVVLDAGQVVGIGTHRELLETSDTYREIVYSQLSEAEAVA
ncbi:MAG TPA: ABC transporter ATP-binding protein [Candidatus Limnocylindrales bacterium]|nr:ABC transporter ATP-binding protein [Candidatus Limnocylindrales bacterium]